MTAEKLDEADALHGQYGKSESINQSPLLPFALLFFHLLEKMSQLFVAKINLSIIIISTYLLQLGLYQSTMLNQNFKKSIARIPSIFLDQQSLRTFFFSLMSFGALIIFFRYVTKVQIPPLPHVTNRNKITDPLPPNRVT